VPAGEGSEATGTGVVRSGDEKGACRKGYRESELSVVPRKQGNAPRADPVEGREGRLTELLEGHMAGAQEPGTVSTKQQRIAKLAGEGCSGNG